MKHPIEEIYMGTMTVGERGQVVIPAELRKIGDIRPGDKLFILKSPVANAVTICKLGSAKDLLKSVLENVEKLEHLSTEKNKNG